MLISHCTFTGDPFVIYLLDCGTLEIGHTILGLGGGTNGAEIENEAGTVVTDGYNLSNGPGVQVMLLDEDQYRRFQTNLTPSEYLYLSKAATNGVIDAAIPHSGKYYLIFSNSSTESSANDSYFDVARWLSK